MYQKRNVTFDIVRALCILWIVGFWHLKEYFPQYTLTNRIGEDVTYAVLATFSFMSGLFLGKKYKGVLPFYRDRIKRFGVLLFLAAFLMALGGWMNWTSFLLVMTGTSSFVPPPVKTMWYFSMLILFYLFTPFIIYNLKDGVLLTSKLKCYRALFFLVILILFSFVVQMDSRIIWNFVFYSFGLIIPIENVEKILKKQYVFGVSICLAFLSYFFKLDSAILFSFFGLIAIVFLSDLLRKIECHWLNNVFSRVSYCSMCAYLFHRHVYKSFTIFFKSSDGMNVFLWPIMLVSILLIAFMIQKIYDSILKKMSVK